METIPKPELSVREASNDDLLKIRQMHAASWLVTYPNEDAGVSEEWIRERVEKWTTPEGIKGSREHFKNIFGNPDHFYRVAELDGEVVGLVHALLDEGKQHLGALYINESQYGTGLAQRLMDAALSWFDLSKLIDLEVVAYNGRAIRFYEKNGFEVGEGSEHLFAEKMMVVTMMRKGDEL